MTDQKGFSYQNMHKCEFVERGRANAAENIFSSEESNEDKNSAEQRRERNKYQKSDVGGSLFTFCFLF